MPQLKKGDTIGIIAPSSPLSAFCPRRTKRGIEALEKMGFKVKIGQTVDKVGDFTAGTIKDRVDDIHDFFKDNQVKMILATIGGYNANDLLDALDYDLIKKNNDKLFMGYSDISILLLVLQEKCQVQTLLGPMLLPQFGEFPEILDFTKKSFIDVTSELGNNVDYLLPASDEMTEEMLFWDKMDNRKRIMRSNSGMYVVSEGKAQGRLMAANLNSLLKLAGTDYWPNFENAILFLEDDDEESPATIQRMFQQLKQIGVFSQIRGLVFGRFQAKSEVSEDSLKKILKNILGDFKFPIMANVDFGHTDPMLTLPFNKRVNIDTEGKKISIVL